MSARFVQAQSSAPQEKPLTFEAASVRLAKAPNGVTVSGGRMMVNRGSAVQVPRNTGGPGTDDPGRIHYPFISLKDLLGRAWSSFEIESPGWLDAQTVSVEATMPADTTMAQFQEMLRNLIIARFGLVFHVGSKEIASYALVVAKGGPRVKESADQNGGDNVPPPAPTKRDADGFPVFPGSAGHWSVFLVTPGDRTRWIGHQQTMHDLAQELAGRLHSVVTDTTGLTAKYDLTLTYVRSAEPGGVVASSPADGAEPLPDIFTAVQSQLGLRLEPRKVSVEFMVVDRMEKTPVGN
jgi:uncharacterized protein (TIGR03435 family)